MTNGRTVKLDTLIIGGGIQGLWLLKDLSEQGYSTLLLTKGQLGDGQTLHSQLRVQGGHSVGRKDETLITSCRDVSHDIWNNFLEEHPDVKAMGDSNILFRWRKSDSRDRWIQFCIVQNLNFAECRDQSTNLGLIQREDSEGNWLVFSSDETWLDGRKLIGALTANVCDRIYQGTANRIDVDEAGNVRVVAQINDIEYDIQPKTLVLAAGSGNVDILSEITFCVNQALQDWKSFFNIFNAQYSLERYNIIVLRGNLPNLTGLFQFDGESNVDIFSRRDENNQIVWLSPIKDDTSNNKITRDRIEDLCYFLTQLNSPDILPDRLQWGMYEGNRVAIKVADSTSEVVARQGNLWVVWPNWLTLAPLASQEITTQIKELIGSGSNVDLSKIDVGSYSEIAEEKWQTVAWENWSDFRERWNIDEDNI